VFLRKQAPREVEHYLILGSCLRRSTVY